MKQIAQKLSALNLKELKYPAVIFAAVYLTFLAGRYIPNMESVRVPVFLGILALCLLLVYGRKRFFQSRRSPKEALLSAAAALVLVVVCQNLLLPCHKVMEISLKAESAGEVCFCDALVDGYKVPLSKLSVRENSGWQYRGEYDNYVTYPQEDAAENRLTLKLRGREIYLTFVSSPWAGAVTVATPEGDSLLDLRAEEDSRCYFFIEQPSSGHGRYYTTFERFVYSAGAAVVLGFLCSVFFDVRARSSAPSPRRR